MEYKNCKDIYSALNITFEEQIIEDKGYITQL